MCPLRTILRLNAISGWCCCLADTMWRPDSGGVSQLLCWLSYPTSVPGKISISLLTTYLFWHLLTEQPSISLFFIYSIISLLCMFCTHDVDKDTKTWKWRKQCHRLHCHITNAHSRCRTTTLDVHHRDDRRGMIAWDRCGEKYGNPWAFILNHPHQVLWHTQMYVSFVVFIWLYQY